MGLSQGPTVFFSTPMLNVPPFLHPKNISKAFRCFFFPFKRLPEAQLQVSKTCSQSYFHPDFCAPMGALPSLSLRLRDGYITSLSRFCNIQCSELSYLTVGSGVWAAMGLSWALQPQCFVFFHTGALKSDEASLSFKTSAGKRRRMKRRRMRRKWGIKSVILIKWDYVPGE